MNHSITAGKSFRIVFVTCLVIWMNVHVIVLVNYHLPLWQAVTDSVISNILLAGCSILVLSNMRFYLPGKERYWYVLLMGLGLSSLWFIAARSVLWLIYKDDNMYTVFLRQGGAIRYSVAFLFITCTEAMGLLWYTQQEQAGDEERKQEILQISREAELFKLRQQFQPHFLFNSLNSISALTGTQPLKARHMIEQLSDFLRRTLRKDEDLWNMMNEEIEYLELYLDIEKVRFGERLQTSITNGPGVSPLKIPALLLQPIVENAIKFGLYDTVDEVLITIDAVVQNEQLKITISNPFDAQTSGNFTGTGFGLSSVRRRLYLLFARHDLLNIETTEKLFITIIIIPQL